MSIGIILPATAQNIASYVPKDGLVGWWPFNGNANDESGNGNHGVVNGANLTDDRNGKANCAYNFNSSVLSSISIDLQKDISNTFSLSFWVLPNSSIKEVNETESCINSYSFDLLKEQNWAIYPGNGQNNLSFGIGISVGTNAIQTGEHSLNVLTCRMSKSSDFSKATNIVLVYTIDSLHLYTSGVKMYSKKISCPSELKNLISPLIFGGQYPGEKNFEGTIDDIGIWNRALIQEEITALYTSTPLCTNPSAVITPQGNPTFCQGGFVNLNASIGQNFTYDWYKDSQIINGANDVFYQANTSGIYTVKVMDGACNTRSNEVAVTVNPLPTSGIAPQGNTTFCQGGSLNLVANGGTSYQWSTGSSNNTIEVNKSGTYTVNAFNIFGCQATASQEVTVNTNPTVTLNSLNQFTLKTQSPIQLVGNPAGGSFSGDGLNGSMFIPVESKLGRHIITYSYTNPQGCNGMATVSTILVDSVGNVCSFNDTIRTTITDTVSILKIKVHLTTGVKANQLTSLSVYPNPTSDVLIIEVNDVQALSDYKYRILDVSGKEVYNALVKDLKTEISFKSIGSKGSYILHIVDGNGNSIKEHKIILE